MGAIKQTHIVAKEIADDIIKDIYKQCEWQIGQFLPDNIEGNEYNEAHSYLVSLTADKVAKHFK